MITKSSGPIQDLDNDPFDFIIKNTPLVSIDLIIRNKDGKYLLNLRGRYPAYKSWFFFGGRIKKAERIKDAFYRIIDREFKGMLNVRYEDATFNHKTEHFYRENRDGQKTSEQDGIHYVVLCYEVIAELSMIKIERILNEYKKDAKRKEDEDNVRIDPEAIDIRWFKKKEILSLPEPEGHKNVKMYFEQISVPTTGELLSLYQIQSKSLNNYTTVIWAFPMAFLLIMGNIYKKFDTNPGVMIISIVFAIALVHAFWKHTTIHKALRDSIRRTEEKLKEVKEIGIFIPRFINKGILNIPSHIIILVFLIGFTIFYTILALMKIDDAIPDLGLKIQIVLLNIVNSVIKLY